MSSDSKNEHGFLVDKFFELVKTTTSMLWQFFWRFLRLSSWCALDWCPFKSVCRRWRRRSVSGKHSFRFFLFRNKLVMLSENFVQLRMDRNMTLINGSYWNFRLQLSSAWFRTIDSFVLNKFEKSFIKRLKSCSKVSWSGGNSTLISIALSLTCTDQGLLTSYKSNLKQKRSSKAT